MKSGSAGSCIVLAVWTLALGMSAEAAPRGRKPVGPPPDLTKPGVEVNTKNDFNLGPTGARGWLFVKNTGVTVGSLTYEARQILVTSIETGSPADGVLRVGDVILGVAGKPFDDDARKCLGRAITIAEEARNKGLLELIVWREGKKQSITLRLRVMGTYSDSSPYDCPKAKKILDDGLRYIIEHPKMGNRFHLNELALMASGRKEYAELVRERARAAAPTDLDIDWVTGKNASGKTAWGWGYRVLFLSEYFLLTGDEAVVPALRTYAVNLAMAQSGVGTWGHGGAHTVFNDGKLHGPLSGYGAMNQPGLICTLGILLTKKAGIEHRELDDAVARSARFFAYYVGKGSIPYGDHRPNNNCHDDNGKNSSAAILFDLQGLDAGARFFARMVTASSEDREWGHTGNQFSMLWGAMGAGRGGPEAVAAFMKEQRWYHDMVRCWDGGFVYQPVTGGGGRDGYYGMSPTATFLLAYTLPLKQLYITGRDASGKSRLSEAEIADAIACGVRASACADMSIDELFVRLSSWSPVVRRHAAHELARRKADLVPRLIQTLEGDDRNARVGACWALGQLGDRAAPAVPALTKLLTDPSDVQLQVCAGYALMGLGDAGRPAIPAMLKTMVTTNKDDPREFLQRGLSFALFYPGGALGRAGLLGKSIEGVDRGLLYPAIRRCIRNDDGRARGCMRSTYTMLTPDDVRELADDIIYSIEEKAPSGIMFAKGVRLAGVQLLAKHRAREGMPLALVAMGLGQWGQGYQTGVCLEALKGYGGAAREIMPELKALTNNEHLLRFKDNHEKLLKLIDAIEADKEPEPVIDLKDVGGK